MHYKLATKTKKSKATSRHKDVTQKFGNLEPFAEADFTGYSERLNAYVYFIAHNGQFGAGVIKVAKREADEEKVAVTISLIDKTAVFPVYLLLKLRVSLQKF